MKIQITSALAIAFVASFSLMSHHNGVAEEQNKDRTGAPGSTQPCTHCHSPSAAISASSSISVIDDLGNSISEYIPGISYSVEFKVEGAGAAAFGFQATSIHGDGSNAGTFSMPGTNVQLEDVNGRHIVEQSDPLVSGVFTTEWTAPATGAGDVAFYMAGMAVNLAYGNSGDSHHETALSLTEGVNIGVDTESALQVVNPIASSDGISWNAHLNGILKVYSLDGRMTIATNVMEGEMVNINSSEIGMGIQIIQFTPSDIAKFSPTTWKLVIPG
jgi:hypothetical protein